MTNWKKTHPEFMLSIKKGKEGPDDLVEKSLFNLATGYVYEAEKPLVVSQGSGLGSEVEIVKYNERVIPNTTAQIFWLKNRRPEKWRDKQEIEHSGEMNINNRDLSLLTDEELIELERITSKIEPANKQ
jgi:hypothetical protein